MRSVRPVVLAALLSSLAASTAQAITFGEPDGNAHPSVGAIIVNFDEIPYPGWSGYNEWCTTTLVAPRVAVTAAHCTVDLQAAGYPSAEKDIWVSFAEDPVPKPKTWNRVTAIITHPQYHQMQNPSGSWGAMVDPHDIAVLVFEKPVKITPSKLAPVGFLDSLVPSLGQGTDTADFLAVGYGGQLDPDYPNPVIVYYDTRYAAWMGYMNLFGAWLQMSQNPHLDDGGTCYGDSGGPTFWVDAQGRETLVALTSWGDTPCVAEGFYYRTDTAGAWSFMQGVFNAVNAGQL